ncbi:flagellar motor switch protein FliN [Crenobacter sp. SG2305]|nr:flagellar motor switch protein FliN [Crenobacter sp. SG2305]MDN0083442.1 flagellar motor switch protein FliN [Crenobacter sp. SG2305]
MDDWAAALVEQEESVPVPGGAATQVTPATNLFQDFGQAVGAAVGLGDAQNLDMILDIPVQITVELGRTKIAIRNLLQLAQGSVVELEGLAGEPMDVLVNGCLIAQGEVVVVNDKFGIRLTDIITPAERIRRLQK